MSEDRSREDEATAKGSLAGTTVHERYEVVRELGAGSLGRVYLARDRARGGGAVALKVVRHDRLSAEALAYLKAEFQNLARLRHPNVARVYDLDRLSSEEGRQEDLVFFTEELLDGPDIVQATRASLDLASSLDVPGCLDHFLELLVQTLRALAYVHARGLLHADVKPRNLFVVRGEDGAQRVKVMDFHLARELRGPADRSLRGTIAYMAPEVVKGDKSDARADLYSLGVVAYEALTGTLPFSARNPLDVLRAHASEKVTPPRERGAKIPPALEALILRLLEKDPEARFPSANDTIRALNVALGKRFALETAETREGYILSPRFVGRERELSVLLEAARSVQGAATAAAPRSARKRRAVEISLDGLGSDATHLALAAAEAERAERERAARDAGPAQASGAKAELKKTSETRAAFVLDEARPSPRVFAVTGEGGVGKSRLLRELRVLCQVQGLAVHEAKAQGLDARPFAPFLEVLESVLRREGDARVLGRVQGPSGRVELGRVLELMGAVAAPDEGPRAARLRATAALGELLLAGSRDRPYVALLESAESLDEASLELLRYLAEEGGPGRALFVLAARDDGEGTPLAELASLECGAELRLERLPVAASGELVASMLAAERVPEELARRLHDATGGNPRFMEESLRALAEAGAVVNRGGELALKPEVVANLGVPTGVVAVTRRRLAGLEGPPRALLEAYAVFARPRSLAFAARVAQVPAADAEPALAELQRRGLVTEVPGEPHGPLHELASRPVRDAALEALPRARAVALHRASVLALEEEPATGGRERAEELLHHFAAAGDTGRAFASALEAAEAARARFEPVRAQRLAARALDLAEKAREAGSPPAAALVARARARLGEARLQTGDRRGAAVAFAATAHDPAAPASLVALAHRLDGALKKSLGAYDRAERALDKAARAAHVAAKEGDPEGEREQARVQGERASVRLWRGDYAGALDAGSRAVERLRALGAKDELAPLLQVLYHAAHFSGDDARARELLRGALEAEARDDPRARADERAPGPRAALAALEGRAPGKGAAALGDAGGAHVPLSTVGVAFDRAGRAHDLEALYEQKVDVLEAVRDGEGAALAHNNLANLRRLAGRYDLAVRGYRRSLALHRQLGGRPGVAVARLNLARAMSELGDPAGAEPRAERARATARACGSRWIEAQAELAIADACRRQGKLPQARESVARARTIVEAIRNVPLAAEVELAAAEVELDARDAARTLRALDGFAQVPSSAASAPSVARARILRARLLVERARIGPESDRALILEQAEEAASDALATARTLGAPELEWRAARARAEALAAKGEREAALEDVVRAMETLRKVAKGLPRDLRALYLSDPARLEVKEAFRALGG